MPVQVVRMARKTEIHICSLFSYLNVPKTSTQLLGTVTGNREAEEEPSVRGPGFWSQQDPIENLNLAPCADMRNCEHCSQQQHY